MTLISKDTILSFTTTPVTGTRLPLSLHPFLNYTNPYPCVQRLTDPTCVPLLPSVRRVPNWCLNRIIGYPLLFGEPLALSSETTSYLASSFSTLGPLSDPDNFLHSISLSLLEVTPEPHLSSRLRFRRPNTMNPPRWSYSRDPVPWTKHTTTSRSWILSRTVYHSRGIHKQLTYLPPL